jgi:hypothetical protein
MTLRSVPIDSITEDHLRSLIADRVAELRFIEYKRELPGRSNGEKRESSLPTSAPSPTRRAATSSTG